LITNWKVLNANLRQKTLRLLFLILELGRRKIFLFQVDVQASEAFNDFGKLEIIENTLR
jgi:hypothetical protein